MKKTIPLNPKYLHECFTYCQTTGELHWSEDRPEDHFNSTGLYNRYMTMTAGTLAGAATLVVASKKKMKIQHRYCRVKLNNKKLYAHRIIWAMLNNRDPEDMLIDHINGNGLDNRSFNLRATDNSGNLLNTWKHRKQLAFTF